MRLLLALLLACQGGGAEPPSAELPGDVLLEVGEELTIQATATGRAFTFTFGDGTTVEGDELRVSHRWDEPGHYTVFVEATGDGPPARDQMHVTVVWPLADTPPRHASPLVADSDHWYAVLPDDDEVVRVHRETHAVERMAVCDGPRTVSVAGADVAVACEGDDTLGVGPWGALEMFAMPRGSRPYGVVVGVPTLVTLPGTGQFAHFWEGQPEPLWLRDVFPDIRGLAVGEKVWVSRWRSPGDAGKIAQFGWSAEDMHTYDLAPSPGPDSDTDSRGLPNLLQQIVINPDGRTAVIPGLKSNIYRGLATDGREPDHETTVRSMLRQISIDRYPDTPAVGTELAHPLFDNRDHAIAAAFSPRGDYLYIAQHGVQIVDIHDAYTMERVGGVRNVGEGPDGLVISEDGTTMAVLCSLSQELVLYDVRNPTAVAELARIDLAPASPALSAQVRLGKQLFYAAVDRRMTAEAYVSCGSCHPEGQNDGRTWDFTNRGEGLRNTHSLLGGQGIAPLHWSANFDEVQDFEHDIRGPQQGTGFMADADWQATNTTLGPSKAGLSADLDALAAYVESLDAFPRSPYRNDDGSLTDDAAAGQLIFESAETGCTDCHTGPRLTDSAWLSPGVPNLHDVGTITSDSGQRLGEGPIPGIDTPTLRGLFATAPYLHDGSADTVMSVLTEHNPTDQHGATSQLDAEQLRQLEMYLLSLE